MLFIFDTFLAVAGFFFLLTLLSGLSLFLRVRRHVRNPFDQPPGASAFHDSGNVIEGEYKVIEEEEKK